MGFFDIFRRKPAIRDRAALAEFIDGNAAFLMQKGLYEYARARAGHYAKVMFREPDFLQAIEVARWRAYPLGLIMVGELVEGLLRPHTDDSPAMLESVSDLVLSIFDRYPVPTVLGGEEWRNARAELARQLQLAGLHPPKRAIHIPEQWTQTYFDLMPIHEKLRGSDFPTTRNYLRAAICNIHDEFVERLDAPAVMASLGQQSAA